MKTKTNTRQACILTIVLWALVSGTTVVAQSDPDEFTRDEINKALIRLDALMKSIEEACRYVAPSVEYDEILSARERLDILVARTENEIRYNAPDIEQEMEFELANKKNKLENKENALLTDSKKLSKFVLWLNL